MDPYLALDCFPTEETDQRPVVLSLFQQIPSPTALEAKATAT
jgi:hypothetical protein